MKSFISFTPLSRWLRGAVLLLTCVFFVSTIRARSSAGQSTPPDGPGKAELQKLCVGCHELEKAYSIRQDEVGWQRTMEKMVAFGMKCSEEEYQLALDYLVKNYAADEVPKVRVNKATAIELESGLSLKRSQAKALIEYREKNGPFKSLDDLKKVPGLEADQLEARKDRISFEQ
jgi:competence protein ComEA